MAVASYESSNGYFPPAYLRGPDGKPWHSWRILLLPFIEQDPLFKLYRFDEPWNGPYNAQLADRMPQQYAYHKKRNSGLIETNYLAVVGSATMWPGATARKRDEIKDGASTTILIVENHGLGIHWMEPRDLAFDSMPFDIDNPDG